MQLRYRYFKWNYRDLVAGCTQEIMEKSRVAARFPPGQWVDHEVTHQGRNKKRGRGEEGKRGRGRGEEEGKEDDFRIAFHLAGCCSGELHSRITGQAFGQGALQNMKADSVKL